MRYVAMIAAVGLVLNVVVLWLLDGATPGPYDLGRVLGVHLVALLVTGLIATVTKVGSTGTLVAVYLLAFFAIQVLLITTNLT
jgi:hypothetical protein